MPTPKCDFCHDDNGQSEELHLHSRCPANASLRSA